MPACRILRHGPSRRATNRPGSRSLESRTGSRVAAAEYLPRQLFALGPAAVINDGHCTDPSRVTPSHRLPGELCVERQRGRRGDDHEARSPATSANQNVLLNGLTRRERCPRPISSSSPPSPPLSPSRLIFNRSPECTVRVNVNSITFREFHFSITRFLFF